METYFTVLAFVFGAVIGSFLNVVIYRLHTGRSINGHSHCLSCQKPLRWYELIPILSYIAQRGRCRGCGAYVPLRYLLVELLTALSFLYLYTTIADTTMLVLLAIFTAVLIVGVVYDLYHMIIPNEIPVVLTGLSIVLLALQSANLTLVAGVILPLAAGVVAAGFYAGLWYVSQGRWIGLGDAKLAFPLGLLLSFEEVFSMIIFSFWIGAVIAIALLALQSARRRYRERRYAAPAVENSSKYLTMKSEIPFAPFLVLAFITVYYFGVDVLTLTEYVVSSFITF